MVKKVSIVIIVIFLLVCTNCKQQKDKNVTIVKEKIEMSNVVNDITKPLDVQPEIEDSGKEIEYTISKTIGSNMVVQRNNYFNVFGWSENIGGIIYGEFMGEKRYAVIDEKGNWNIQFSPHEANSTPQTLKIYPKNGKVTEYSDILIGDIWIIAGQSNAELNMSLCLNKDKEYAKEINENDSIRIFAQDREFVFSIKNKIDLSVPQKDIVNDNYKWEKTTLRTVNKFSALGYYFAKELSKMVDVPFGVIMTAAGGATIHELMPNEVLENSAPLFAPSVVAGGFYNSLMHPFINNPITGMIFYQGESESNAGHYKRYESNLINLFNGYRKAWKLEFPIINVQLSTHGEEGEKAWYEIQNIRAVQFDVSRKLSNNYLIVSRDHGIKPGDDDFGHPRYKRQLGVRAANVAAMNIYEIANLESKMSPEPTRIIWNKDHILVDFDYVGDGLKLLEGNTLEGFVVLDEAGNNIACAAEITDKNTIKITVSGEAATLQFAMFPNATLEFANLGNSEGLPVPTFEISK